MKLIMILLFLNSCKDNVTIMPSPTVVKSCQESIKGEYQNYFESVEKCIEKESEWNKLKIKQNNPYNP
jgi:hypothetical protein